MLTQKTAAYGSWKSPITADLVAQSITLSEARFDGVDVYWLEGRSQELGRLVVRACQYARRPWYGRNAETLQRAHAGTRIRWSFMDSSRRRRPPSKNWTLVCLLRGKAGPEIGGQAAHPPGHAMCGERQPHVASPGGSTDHGCRPRTRHDGDDGNAVRRRGRADGFAVLSRRSIQN